MSDPKYKNVGEIETRAIEECSELIHILCKVQRFGVRNWHPSDKLKTPNYKLVQREIEDVKGVLAELENRYNNIEQGVEKMLRLEASHE